MSGYKLLSDFNRSLRLERTQAEHDARSIDPGAIVAANLDRDDRTLPARVAAGAEIPLDATLASKSARDNDPAPVLLAADRGAGQHRLGVGITSLFMHGICMLDEHKNVLRPVIGMFLRKYDFGDTQNDVSLFVEVSTLAGSPLRGFPTLSPARVDMRRVPTPLDERRFSLTMNARPLAGGATDSQDGIFTIAPWIMVDESAPLLRLYIVDTEDNHPSVEDVRRALPDPSKLTLVPSAVATHDTWLQDQFELGCFHTPAGVSLVLLHMPRLRRNYTGRGATTGLPNFVRSHFPSRTVGVYDEFWQRTLPVEDISGRRVNLNFEQSGKVREALIRPFLLRTHLLDIATSVLSANPLRDAAGRPLVLLPFVSLSQALQDIAAWAPRILSQLDRDIAAATVTAVQNLLRAYKRDVDARRAMVNDAVAVAAGGVTVTAKEPPTPGGTSPRVVWTATISCTMADRLEERLAQMHASQNYGGNLQLGPPTPDMPYGRIFIGNDVLGREGLVDPELLNFLDKQRVQPLTQIDTSWLAVAHVDEILSFVPRRRGSGTHAIWLNSTKLALDIVEAARSHYLAGLPSTDTYIDHPSSISKRELNEGTSPITAMFRGKLWHHSHQPGSAETQEPAQLYIAMAEFYQRGVLSIHDTPWIPGPGDDRTYPAKMTIRELRYFEAAYRHPDPDFVPAESTPTEAAPTLSTNELIEQNKLADLRAQVEDACPGTGVVLVPTIYDIIHQPNASTGAYTPNAANLVIADSRLLIPKPFGPRVKPVDAVAIITEALTDNGQESLLNEFNERWLRNARVGLLGVKQWFRHDDMAPFGSGDDLSLLAKEFKDGLIGISDSERQQLILRANRSAFRNGNLRSGWHDITIPEDTVDLFEVAIALAAKSLGMEWRFVDSWSYHITFGEIHCGTNALRSPTFSGVSPWWEFYFRAPPQ
jgi:hypothetical protein